MAFWNKKKNKPKHITLSKTEYGKAVLSYIIIQQGEKFKELSKEHELDVDFTEYLTFLQYIVYISQKILETRFAPADATEIAISSFDGIVEYLEFIDDKKKLILVEFLKEDYTSLKEFIKFDISKQDEMHSLVNAFLEDIGVEKSFICHSTFFMVFSGYIIHHTSSIFNENISIV